MKILRPQFAPPGGSWFYRDVASGRSFETRDGLGAIVAMVRRFLEMNKRTVPENLQDAIEDYMCRHLPKGVCSGQDDRPEYEIMPGFFEVSSKMDRFFQENRTKLSFCDSIVSEARIRKCMPCPRHFMGICTTCDGLRSTARSYVGGRTTRFDNQVGVCLATRLPIAAVVHLNNLTRRDGCPAECWVGQ